MYKLLDPNKIAIQFFFSLLKKKNSNLEFLGIRYVLFDPKGVGKKINIFLSV